MFPMCHIYFAEKVIGELSHYSILGSIYPDIVISGILNRDITHYNTCQLSAYYKGKDKNMEEFSVGAVSHGVDMQGLDFYSDEKYKLLDKGYCFDKAKEIEKDVVSCCNIPPAWGLWKAHNFIEMAFDLYLCGKNKWIMDYFKSAIEDKYTVEYVCSSLEKFYGISGEIRQNSFRKFAGFVQYDNMNEYSIMEKYAVQLNKKHDIQNVNIELGSEVLTRSVEIIEKEIDDFFDFTVKEVKAVINFL